jgi:hypothetical protein
MHITPNTKLALTAAISAVATHDKSWTFVTARHAHSDAGLEPLQLRKLVMKQPHQDRVDLAISSRVAAGHSCQGIGVCGGWSADRSS